MDVVDQAERKVELLKQAIDLAERLHANESERQHLLLKRNMNCRELKAAGTSIKDLQKAYGVSRSRVQQILSNSAD